MSDQNGLRQSPFSEAACPTPSTTSGDQGIGGGFDPGSGENGLRHTPWANPITPTPSGMVESGPFGNPSRYSSVDGGTHQGESLQGDITATPKNTIDKR